MRHWSQLGIRNWRVRPGRTAGAIGAIALGVGVVVWVTCAYESVRLALQDKTWFWIGRSHLSVESFYGEGGTVYQSLAEKVAAIDNVRHVTCRLKHAMMLHPVVVKAGTTQPVELPGRRIEAIGIDPANEYQFRDYSDQRIGPDSRMLTTNDAGSIVIEQQLADQLNLAIGDRAVLRTSPPSGSGRPDKSGTFTIVGIIEHRRVAKQQLPIAIGTLAEMQALAQFDDDIPRVTQIDLILRDAEEIRATEKELRTIVDRERQGFMVTSAEGKLRQVKSAEQQTGFVLALLSSVALFTGFFIILSTLSMGMVERIGQLGLLRCQGTTRFQTAILVISEAVPMGLIGMVLGVPIGLGLARLSVYLAPEYVGQFAISKSGLVLALVGGAVTTLGGAGLPMLQAMRVSPLAASRPQSQPPPGVLIWAAAVGGLGMVVAHGYTITHLPGPALLLHPLYPVTVVMLLYGGCALLMPALIRVVGQVAVLAVSKLLVIRPHLLSDQIGRAVWRSATICCGLMVGLSMIVSLVIQSRSISAGWDFPKDFAEAFVFISPPTSLARAEKIKQTPGIASSCLINEGIQCTVYGQGMFHFPVSRFVAGEPDGFFEIANLEFVEGNKADAVAKLRQGGYVLVTPEFTRVNNLTYGQKVPIRLKDGPRRLHEFEIAGVVTSPALDIAAKYFNRSGELIKASVFIVMGTFDDAKRVFGMPEIASMFLINFDLPDTVPPPEFHADVPPPTDDPTALAEMVESWRPLLPKRTAELDAIRKERESSAADGMPLLWNNAPVLRVFQEALSSDDLRRWSKLDPQQRWQTFREELVMGLVAGYSSSTENLHASVRSLKQRIIQDLHRATLLFASVPMVALIIAALGVGNLMMANVTSRTRQIAMLRAVGATKWQVTRLVIGEAVVLGCIGCIVGVLIGLGGAFSLRVMISTIWGIKPPLTIPWNWVGLGIAFTMCVCLVAGVLPARYAARNNIIDALQQT